MEIFQVPMVREANQESYSIQEFPVLKEKLSELCSKYKNLVVTEDAISEAKVDRAYLNKRKKGRFLRPFVCWILKHTLLEFLVYVEIELNDFTHLLDNQQ